MKARARRIIGRMILAAGWIWLAGCLLIGWLVSPVLAPMTVFDILAAIGFIIAYALSVNLRSAA